MCSPSLCPDSSVHSQQAGRDFDGDEELISCLSQARGRDRVKGSKRQNVRVRV